jgi:Putative transmembrane protein (PGPGW)
VRQRGEPEAGELGEVRGRAHELEHELEEAAIEAEFETGRREDSVEEAKRHVAWRMVRISLGIVVTGFGILLLALPGPGLVVVALGLGILAQDVPFARRLLDRVQDRIPRDDDGNLPLAAKLTLVGSIVLAIVLSGISIWWSFFH